MAALPLLGLLLIVSLTEMSSLASAPQPGDGDRFTVPAGFRVEVAVAPPVDGKSYSFTRCCFDDQGRLLVASENGPIYLCTNPDKDGVLK